MPRVWGCTNCKAQFVFGTITPVNNQPTRNHPMYCPYCGYASIFDHETPTTFVEIKAKPTNRVPECEA